MSQRTMESAIEMPKFLSGMGGFPRLPQETRHYACNIGYSGWTCYRTNTNAFCPTCKTVEVPAYLPEFLDKYVIQHKFKERVTISEHPMSLGTSCLSKQRPSEQHPESPSVRQVPSVAYTGVHKQPRNPFQ